jgi:hypothetical protein
MKSQEDVWVCPRDLLCISWGSLDDQIGYSWISLDSLEWILKQCHDADLEVYAKEFDILQYLEAFRPNDDGNKAQINKVQTTFAI